jgi:hypothetical protein
VAGPLGVLVDPYSVVDFANGLSRALTDDTVRARAAREGPAWASRFRWDEVGGALLAACKEVFMKANDPSPVPR